MGLIRYFCVPCAPTKANGGRTRNYPQHDPAKWQLFKEYCRQDVVTEMEIERRLSAFPVPDFVQKQWETDLIINARGVAVDMDFVSGALYLGSTVRKNLMQEATDLSKLDNPNSVGQLTQVPGHMNLDKIVNAVKQGVAMAGGTPIMFPAIAVCDGIAMGHIGMKYSLVTRDLIADSTECMALAHQFDALVMVPNCDKNVPGLLMAAARINVPTVFVSGGPMFVYI